MKNSKRDFLKKATLLTTGASLWKALPVSIEKALCIAPDKDSSFYDAEHVVILMQSGRSFDHFFGTLRGVRGFNDHVAIELPDNIPVWFQANKAGQRFTPFRLDIEKSRAAQKSGIQHSWARQVDARNEGKYDRWLDALPSHPPFQEMPLTMGYYIRQDLPFYYALADAFTVCDQHFSATLAGSRANRNYLFTGKTHDGIDDKPRLRECEMGPNQELHWTTFPERLEKAGISWKVYQNEISLPSNAMDSSLLTNFTNNNLEWFAQYHVRYSRGYYEYLTLKEKQLNSSIAKRLKKLESSAIPQKKKLSVLEHDQNELNRIKALLKKWSPKHFSELPAEASQLHKRAFTTNKKDPDYHNLEQLSYEEDGQLLKTMVPKGDILYKFRKDVKSGKLPTVSYLVTPEQFSDHPGAPCYGAWYVSAVLDILTQNPKVWKKTIFILGHDSNKGYFDHIPPYVVPTPGDPTKGMISEGLDVQGEFVTREQELAAGFSEAEARTSPVGLGCRVPLIIASPWSRGGWVNSEISDTSSVIRLLETILTKKTGTDIREPNISSWRRTVSGDLSSCFRPYHGEKVDLPVWLDRNKYIQEMHNAQFYQVPNHFKPLTKQEAMAQARQFLPSVLPRQEPGTKPSNGLRYELYVDGYLDLQQQAFIIELRADNQLFGLKALGAPFSVYAPDQYLNTASGKFGSVNVWHFAVKAGDRIVYRWPLAHFKGEDFHLRVYGPNGFYRDFLGNKNGPALMIQYGAVVKSGKPPKNGRLTITNSSTELVSLQVNENRYDKRKEHLELAPGEQKKIKIKTERTSGWYDFTVTTEEKDAQFRYAGRLETGKDSISDPYLGQTI